MANKRAFEIAFVGLKPGIHEFDYEVDDKFFAEKGVTDFTNCNANIKLSLDKKSSFMLLKFEIGGKANVTCDRCGNALPMDIWDEFNMLVKLVENPEEMNGQEEDPDVFYISKTESHIDVGNWIYEFVLLSFPIQKTCSEEEKGGPLCNKEVLEKLRLMEVKQQEENSNQIWKGLEQFKVSKKRKSN
ncbi:YceD family protein [Ferruginibacter sp.]